MDLQQRISNLSGKEAIWLYSAFSGYLMKKVSEAGVKNSELLRNPPGELKNVARLQPISEADMDKLGKDIEAEEKEILARVQLEQWAKIDGLNDALEHFMDNNKIQTAAAATILALGVVVVSSIISASLKFSYENGEFQVSYDPDRIKEVHVQMLKAVFDAIPKSLISIKENKGETI